LFIFVCLILSLNGLCQSLSKIGVLLFRDQSFNQQNKYLIIYGHFIQNV